MSSHGLRITETANVLWNTITQQTDVFSPLPCLAGSVNVYSTTVENLSLQCFVVDHCVEKTHQ